MSRLDVHGPDAVTSAQAGPGVRKVFIASLNRRQQTEDAPFPDQLAGAAADVLGADAASIALLQPFLRLPLGASAGGARAEQVQASFGGGPCVDSSHLDGDVALDEADLEDRWPSYILALRDRTPFRSVVSVPLVRGAGTVFGALDLYATRASWGASLPGCGARAELAALVSTLLAASAREGRPAPSGSQEWTRRRRQCWIALGMLCRTADLSESDSLALLRAYARSTDRLLDDLADDVVSGRIALATVVDRQRA